MSEIRVWDFVLAEDRSTLKRLKEEIAKLGNEASAQLHQQKDDLA